MLATMAVIQQKVIITPNVGPKTLARRPYLFVAGGVSGAKTLTSLNDILQVKFEVLLHG